MKFVYGMNNADGEMGMTCPLCNHFMLRVQRTHKKCREFLTE